jgi:hypothetical protein
MRVLLACILAVGLVGCAQPPDDAAVTGVVIAVDGNLTEVAAFTIVTPGEEQLTFVPDPDGGNPGFPLVHLAEHMRSGDSVEVRYEERDGVLVATWVDDAGGGH